VAWLDAFERDGAEVRPEAASRDAARDDGDGVTGGEQATARVVVIDSFSGEKCGLR